MRLIKIDLSAYCLSSLQVEESGNMAETLADRVDKNYANLAKEINGLHKVEQVLLDTADGVLDTKRRLEFAVQQILLELGDSIRRQTGDLNSTLARKVDDVTFSVIANQSTALTNMTSKLESELGQVHYQAHENFHTLITLSPYRYGDKSECYTKAQANHRKCCNELNNKRPNTLVEVFKLLTVWIKELARYDKRFSGREDILTQRIRNFILLTKNCFLGNRTSKRSRRSPQLLAWSAVSRRSGI